MFSISGGKLSIGSILLIGFFSLVFVYLAFGAVFLKLRRGATGVDVIPNADFWSSTLGLVKDGALFLFRSKRGIYETL